MRIRAVSSNSTTQTFCPTPFAAAAAAAFESSANHSFYCHCYGGRRGRGRTTFSGISFEREGLEIDPINGLNGYAFQTSQANKL